MAIKFRAVRDFLAMAEHGSLRAASRQLGSAHTAISRNIQKLEKALGVVLFVRHPFSVRLTQIGEVFLRRTGTTHNELQLSEPF